MTNTRNIFEDVTGDQASTPLPDKKPTASRRGVSIWLMIIFALVMIMIVVGGMTRLTDSGLSITEWKPITGAIPPLNAADWMAEFTKYQATPEFQLVNRSMTLPEFKGIYWWEWGHRFLGRFIGLVWGVGFVWFWLRKTIPTGWTGRLLGLGFLGGLQGAVGWWMVASGLTGRMVDVASYRLAIHLGLAFIILGLIGWYVVALSQTSAQSLQARRQRNKGLMTLTSLFIVLLFIQVLLGALVAGIDAGRGYTDWPMMGGEFLPSESFGYTPLWSNFFENPALVQWNHRMIGYLAAIMGVFIWYKSRKSSLNGIKASYTWVLWALILQVALGIITVIYGAPVYIAIIHQIGAVMLFIFAIRARFEAAYPATQKIRRG